MLPGSFFRRFLFRCHTGFVLTQISYTAVARGTNLTEVMRLGTRQHLQYIPLFCLVYVHMIARDLYSFRTRLQAMTRRRLGIYYHNLHLSISGCTCMKCGVAGPYQWRKPFPCPRFTCSAFAYPLTKTTTPMRHKSSINLTDWDN